MSFRSMEMLPKPNRAECGLNGYRVFGRAQMEHTSLIQNVLLLSSLTGIICLLPTKTMQSEWQVCMSLHSERNQIHQSPSHFYISSVKHTSKTTTLKTICIALCQRSVWLKEFCFMTSPTQGRREGELLPFPLPIILA